MGRICILREWKTIAEYPSYEVSNDGHVRSKNRFIFRNGHRSYVNGVMLKTFERGGYSCVALYDGSRKKKKQIAVHILVAQHFIPNPHGYAYVNHKDENKFNNHYSNLEWCTAKYNSNYGTSIQRRVAHQDWDIIASKLSKPVLQFDLNMRLIREWKSTIDCSRNGHNSSGVSKCCNGKLRTDHNYIWRYKNA